MPIVPFTPGPRTKSGRQLPPPPDEPFALMAAAQMHAEGRLVAQSETPSDKWNSLSGDEQEQIKKGAYPPKEGPEMNKYDETLSEKGSIVLPGKDAFGPNEWQWGKGWPGVDRYDLPDGKVILKKKGGQPLTS